MPSLPALPQNVVSWVTWLSLVITAIVAVTGSFYWCWNNSVPKLFGLPHLSLVNSAATVGLTFLILGFLWGYTWVFVASLRKD